MDFITDPHLNLFRFFNESSDPHYIENNLSRAFAVCLRNDLLFFTEYLREIVQPDDYEYLFSHYEHDSKYLVDLQINTGEIELSGVKAIYAVAMTGNQHLDMQDFLDLKPQTDKEKNVTDVWILIKDIIVVIEVKRTWEDCKQQLYNQVYPLISKSEKIRVEPVKFSWPDALRIMERIANIRSMRQDPLSFVTDFLTLCEGRYPDWFPTQPFYNLPGLSENSRKTAIARDKRLRQIIQQSGEQILGYHDRMAIAIKLPWASEIIPYFRHHQGLDYISFMIWPGNTKTQGYAVYGRSSMDWISKGTMQVGEEEFEIDTEYHMKFCHFNRYISSIDFNDSHLRQQINTKANFYNRSGKWLIDDWDEFEAFMDEHFKPDFDWRKACGWEPHFQQTERTYFTVSFGFATELWVPYKKFQDIDRSPNDFSKPAKFIKGIADAFHRLLD